MEKHEDKTFHGIRTDLLPERVREYIRQGQDGLPPRTTRPKVDVRELVKSLQ